MQPDPGGVAATIQAGGYSVKARVVVYSNFVPVQGPGGSALTAPVSAATVTVDRNSANRRTADLTVEVTPGSALAAYLIPTSSSSPLAPFGNEVVIQSGIVVGGVTKWVPLGVFAIATTTVGDIGSDLSVTMHCYDRSWVIGTRKFRAAYNIPASTGNFAAELWNLINTTYPGLAYNITPTPAMAPTASYGEGDDPWQAALDMAQAVGYDLFFDVNGTLNALPIPNALTQPTVWTYTEGTPNATIAIVNVFSRDGISNDFIVSGTGTQNAPGSSSGSSAPVRASATDTNPASPTYVGGLFGDVPTFISTNLVTTTTQAQTAANNDLAAALSAAQQVTLTVMPNPLLDIDDVIAIYRARLGMTGALFVVDTLTFSVSSADATQITGRVVA